VTFETRFFGPGNRLSWEAIQADSLPKDVKERLGPFLDDLQRNPEVLALPRVLVNGRVQWYILCASPRAARIARDEVRAFLGPTYSDFEGRPTRLDPSDAVDAAVLERYGHNAFRLDVSDPGLFEAARERLRLLMHLRSERPVRHASRLRAVGRILRDFEYAILTADIQAARDAIDELRLAGHLNATNLLFLEVRRLAAGAQWDAILALPELESLLAMPRPRRVTEALISAVYASRLREFEDDGRAAEAVQRFHSEIYPRFCDLYRSRSMVSGYDADVSFMLAAGASASAESDVAHSIVEAYPPNSRSREYLMAIAGFIPEPRGRAEVKGLDEARAAFAAADVDRAYELALALEPSFDRSALLLRCARDIGTLAAAQLALASLEGVSPTERSRLDRNATLCRIRDSLNQLNAAIPPTTQAAFPSSWADWLRRLTTAQPWSAAVAVAGTGAREWSIDGVVSDPSTVQEIAELLLHDRPEWGEIALRDSLPYILESCAGHGADLRLKPVYENLYLLLAVDDRVSLPQATALLTVVGVRLELGVTGAGYRELVGQLAAAIYAVESPSVAPLALEAIELLINSACPDPAERQNFVVRVAGLFHRWHRRVDKSQLVLLRQLAAELGIESAIPADAADVAAEVLESYWHALDGKRVAMYSLQDSALRRATTVLAALCPLARMSTFHDLVGGSPALRAASATADVFVLATAAAKHAATAFIEACRPRELATIYARGQGSSSLLEALREYCRETADLT
jgi:hypothetical protein